MPDPMLTVGSTKTLAIHGAYAVDNFGDTLLLGILAREANRLGWNVLASRTCAATAAQLQGVCSLERLTHCRQLKSADALVYGGGGFFGEQPAGKLRWHVNFLRRHLPIGFHFLLNKKPYGCIGTGFGPLSFWPSRALATFLLKRAATVCLRDQASKDFLTRYGMWADKIEVSADLALTLADGAFPEIDQYSFSKDKPGPVVLLHPSYSVEHDQAQQNLAQHIKSILSDHPEAELRLMVDNPRSISPEAVNSWRQYLSIPPERMFSHETLWKTCALIKSSDIIITNKLHVGIVGATYGKTVLSVAKHPKNPRFFEQIGRSELCQMRGEFDAGIFSTQLRQAIEGQLPPICVPPAVLTCARANFTRLKELLGQA